LETDSEGARWIELAQDHVHSRVFSISDVEASVSATACFFEDDLKVFKRYQSTISPQYKDIVRLDVWSACCPMNQHVEYETAENFSST
jgi:hypothetical protein